MRPGGRPVALHVPVSEPPETLIWTGAAGIPTVPSGSVDGEISRNAQRTLKV